MPARRLRARLVPFEHHPPLHEFSGERCQSFGTADVRTPLRERGRTDGAGASLHRHTVCHAALRLSRAGEPVSAASTTGSEIESSTEAAPAARTPPTSVWLGGHPGALARRACLAGLVRTTRSRPTGRSSHCAGGPAALALAPAQQAGSRSPAQRARARPTASPSSPRSRPPPLGRTTARPSGRGSPDPPGNRIYSPRSVSCGKLRIPIQQLRGCDVALRQVTIETSVAGHHPRVASIFRAAG
jgi:hypothetical protein